MGFDFCSVLLRFCCFLYQGIQSSCKFFFIQKQGRSNCVVSGLGDN